MQASYYQYESAADEVEMDGEGYSPPVSACVKGHRRTVSLSTAEGGTICLICFAALLSDSASPSHHVSYALSQLALASRTPVFLRDLVAFHAHLLVPPLVHALSAFNDEPLARQLIDLVSDLCTSSSDVIGDFVARITDRLSSRALAWTRRQIYTLHCLGVLLNSVQGGSNVAVRIIDRASLFSSLVAGLQLPSEEIRGEILFVLYKLSVLHATPWDDGDDGRDDVDSSSTSIRQILRVSLEALLKTEDNDVRMNCVALLTVFARKGFFENLFSDDKIGSDGRDMSQTDGPLIYTPLIRLFADAIKGPLLSSDSHVQVSSLDLIFHSLSFDLSHGGHIQFLVEENIADYVFEILRRSGNNDALVISCLQVLVLLAKAEVAFRPRLLIGFPTLFPVLHYVADIPLHPVQPQVLKLVLSCLTDCPGIVSITQVEEICLALTRIFTRYASGDPAGMLPETFTLTCSTFVEILKSPSATHIQNLTPLIQEASRNAVLSSLALLNGDSDSDSLLLYSLYLLEEAHIYSQEESSNRNSHNRELESNIIETCDTCLLPWLGRVVDEGGNEEEVLRVFEIFHLILLRGSGIQVQKFAETLASSSLFSLSFGCLGLFPSDQMKSRVYLLLASVTDKALGPDHGQPVRDAHMYLPLDPLELMLLLGQRSSDDPDLSSCQRAVILMLYSSSLYGERLADENEVLASLEQYILVNGRNFSCTIADSLMLTQLVHLYAFLRVAPVSYRKPYSAEAERDLFSLMVENEWELLSVGIHPTALKWLFQQELLMTPLACHLLIFCRLYSRQDAPINLHIKKVRLVDIQMIAELVVSGDNFVTSLLVSLLQQVQEEGREDDTILVVNVMAGILKLFPEASRDFCLNGINDALLSIYCSMHSSPHVFLNCSLLLFNVLYSVDHTALSLGQEGQWFAVTVKVFPKSCLLYYRYLSSEHCTKISFLCLRPPTHNLKGFESPHTGTKLVEFVNPKLASNSCGQGEHLIIGIFCLILHHSTNQVLREASKAILLNCSLISAVDNIVQAAITRGPALLDHGEETGTGESLGSLDWEDFLQPSDEVQSLSVICSRCHDLSRLMHFGSSVVKLVASECLLELLTRISDQRKCAHDELRCSVRYLESMMAVAEGLVFYGDQTVARNCGACLALILGLEKPGLSKWCRLIIEELALSLVAPGLASKSFTNRHKPAAHVAVALLRLEQTPGWMRSVFDASCCSGIISNLSAGRVSANMVSLFRELMLREYLNKDQVSGLHQLFQVCRKQVYRERCQKQARDEFSEAVVTPGNDGEMRGLLVNLMLSVSKDCEETQTGGTRLLEEIELFFQVSTP